MIILDKIKKYLQKRQEFICNTCKKTFNKKECIEVHPSFAALGPAEDIKELCPECFYEHISKKLTTFEAKAVFFYPVSGLEYSYFTLDAAPAFIDDYDKANEFLKHIKSIIPHDGKTCCRCHNKPAQITWCPDTVNTEYWVIDLGILSEVHIEKLCPECFAKIIIEYMKQDVTKLITMFDIANKDGFCISGDL